MSNAVRLLPFEGFQTKGLVKALLALPLLALLSLTASAEDWVPGEHYKVLEVPVESAADSGVEVVEVFSYACVHCYAFDPAIDAWKAQQSTDVSFRRLPAIFNDTWELLARAFYAGEILNVIDAVHGPLFKAIHEQRKDVRNPAVMASVFEEAAGVDPQTFLNTFNSMGITGKVQRADAHGTAYGVTGVPSMVVAGKYLIDGKTAGNNTRMLQVVDYLVAKELAESESATELAESAAATEAVE